MKIAGILFILAGLAAILFGGFSYTSHEERPDMGLIQVDDTKSHPAPIPPILGIGGIVAGGALVGFGFKQRQ
jgi:hypothetical protein